MIDQVAPVQDLYGSEHLMRADHYDRYKLGHPDADYFAVTQFSEEYALNDGQGMVLTFWHRPLHAMTDAFTEAGFRISVISEPPFTPDTPRELLPPQFANRTAFLCFLFFVLEAS